MTLVKNTLKTIIPSNAIDDKLNALEDKALVIDVSTLLKNDIAGYQQVTTTYHWWSYLFPTHYKTNLATLTIVSVQDAQHGAVSLTNGKVSFMPEANYNGPAQFTYTVSDGKGFTNQATVQLSIAPVNDAPDAKDDQVSGNANNVLVIAPSTLLANDSDIDGDTITGVSIQNAVNGTVTWDGTNVLFTPTQGYAGAASFTYTITDGKGATDTATVNLTIAPPVPVNTAPDAKDDAVTGNANTTITIAPATLLANDSDVDGDTITGVSIQDAINGTVTWDGTNVLFIPTQGYAGPASFTYTIADSKGATDTATVNLTIVPNSGNIAPVAEDDSFTGLINSGGIYLPERFLANDVDADGDPLKIISVQDLVNGRQVTLVPSSTGSSQQIVFAANFNAVEGDVASFSYTVSDGKGGFDTATVKINLVNFNDNTQSIDLSQTFPLSTNRDVIYVQRNADGTITLNIDDYLLINDRDYNGNPVSFTEIDKLTSNGNFKGDIEVVDNQLIIHPASDFTGVDYFRYTTIGELGQRVFGNVTLNVVEANAPIVDSGEQGSRASSSPNGTSITYEDILVGSTNNDTLIAGKGNDRLYGGAGSDIMTGGADNDVFIWKLADTVTAGIERDFVTDIGFGDKLDLRDLLVGESNTAVALDNYLHFSAESGNTVISVSSHGTFADNNTSGATVLGTVNQQIVLNNVDLTAGNTLSDQQVIQSLLDIQYENNFVEYRKALITD